MTALRTALTGTFQILASCLALLTLAACEATDTPRGAVEMAGAAVQAGNVKLLRGYLSGAADREFGSAEGLAELRREFAGPGELHLAKPQLIGRKLERSHQFCISGFHPHDPYTRMTVSYHVPILRDQTPLRTADVDCHSCLHLDRHGYLLEQFPAECRISALH